MENKIISTQTELSDFILGRKGGQTTLRIMYLLLLRPSNMNQIAKELDIDYNTARYHVKKLGEHKYVTSNGKDYCCLYYPSRKLIKSINELEQIKKVSENKLM